MVVDLFSYLFLSHLLSDFFLQTDGMLLSKREKRLKGSAIYMHTIIVAALAWLFAWDVEFWFYALMIFLSHLLLDFAKIKCKERRFCTFVIDQMLHLAILAVMSYAFCQTHTWKVFSYGIFVFDWRVATLVSLFLFIMSPVNYMIQEALWRSGKTDSDRPKDPYLLIGSGIGNVGDKSNFPRLENAGAMIGALERGMAFFFVILGNYQAIGFIIAAKSILRFKESDQARAEYVLVGTLLSIIMSIIAGLCASWILFDRKLLMDIGIFSR